MNVAPVSGKSDSQVLTARHVEHRAHGWSFQEVLGALREARETDSTATYTVQQGDSLWGICAQQLSRNGAQASNGTVATAVEEVAKSNGLSNPDRIHAGQSLDLSSLSRTTKSESPGQGGAMPLASARTLRTMRSSHPSVELRNELKTVLFRQPAAVTQDATEDPWASILGREPEISSEFGWRQDPFTGRRQHHDGIDLAVPTGTPVYSLLPGRVAYSGHDAGYGNVVVVRHENGIETVYAHQTRNLVRTGQRVNEKSLVGLSGSTGRSTGPHLHFEVRVNGRAVNPRPFVLGESIKIAQAL